MPSRAILAIYASVPREELFVCTKLYPNQFADAEKAIEESLRKLNIGYVDLMLLHHPGAHDVEAYKAMERAVEAGKIRSVELLYQGNDGFSAPSDHKAGIGSE